MRPITKLFIIVFLTILCPFPLCLSRKGRERNLTPIFKNKPPKCSPSPSQQPPSPSPSPSQQPPSPSKKPPSPSQKPPSPSHKPSSPSQKPPSPSQKPPSKHNFSSSCASNSDKVFNVDDFGAKADDNDTDNFQAFKDAWDSACNSSTSAKVLVPDNKTYYIKHINFTGPCQSSIAMEIRGTIKAFSEMYNTPKKLWVMFQNVANMDVCGGGTVDGNGDVWWKNSCKIKKTQPCQTENAPTALTFYKCTNIRVSSLTTMDAQQKHMNFQDCDGVEASNLSIVAPAHSPNTDGLHMTGASNVKVYDSTIGTGDDCISMVNGTNNVEVSNIVCGPGHGISIGSLGDKNKTEYASNIDVKRVTFTGTTNGVRIKTWQGGSGYVTNIVFEHIMMTNVSNPIIIDQNYCDQKNCKPQKSGVQIENIIYRDIKGTSATKEAITLRCSESVPCRNIILENVMITAVKSGATVDAVCNNIIPSPLQLNSTPSCS